MSNPIFDLTRKKRDHDPAHFPIVSFTVWIKNDALIGFLHETLEIQGGIVGRSWSAALHKSSLG
jgi:hypothetical protein